MSNPFNLRLSQDNCDAFFYTNTIVDVGESHRDRRFNCQDHARALACSQGIVLCVADGVSQVQDEQGLIQLSAAEVGAWLAVELTAVAALAALKSGAPLEGIRDTVAAALVTGLGPVTELLGPRAHRGLSTTLLLMVITPTATHAWASGDGYWGVLVAADQAIEAVAQTSDTLSVSPGLGFMVMSGARHQPQLSRLATTRVSRGVDAVAEQLQPVLTYRGPVLGGYVATDGLRDEPRLLEAVRRPGCTNRTELKTMLRRQPGCDDLGVAWAIERFSMLGGAS